ncbi:hypothetical protein Ocin01_12573 [Orchesella cincta]|uniref:Uncharacterized protein n=1 Tax=Orchesella cincta TaxID=48709 RepID=A0A1D2MM67_ORCCI|nr:hypothetical protein Ocin01_12573 [Orchesella cincta]
MVSLTLKVALLGLLAIASADWEHDFNKRSLLYTRPSGASGRSRSSLPWRYLGRNEDVVAESNESVDTSNSVEAPQASLESVESSVESAEVETRAPVPVPVQSAPVRKGESGRVTVRRPVEDSESEEADRSDQAVNPKEFITFSYYPISQHLTNSGSIVYEIEDNVLRTARSGKKKGKGCKKGKKGKGKGKKKGKGKGKKGKGKKGKCIKGGWWYVWDKKHGYLAGRWGDPPPKGLEREHYWHNFGKHGHGYGQGYDGHGQMGWKVKKQHGWGGHGGGGGGQFGGFGFGGGGGGVVTMDTMVGAGSRSTSTTGGAGLKKQKGLGWRLIFFNPR